MQDGTPCRNAVNIGACPFCDYHVQGEYNKIHSKRTECKDSRLYRAFQYADGSRLGKLSSHTKDSYSGCAYNAQVLKDCNKLEACYCSYS